MTYEKMLEKLQSVSEGLREKVEFLRQYEAQGEYVHKVQGEYVHKVQGEYVHKVQVANELVCEAMNIIMRDLR
jgi:hypothetical protein